MQTCAEASTLTQLVTLAARRRLFGIALVSALLGACGVESGEAPAALPSSTQLLPGVAQGRFLYPEFQRWRVVRVRAVPNVKVPIDLGGIPRILLGRPVYFGPGYMTIPFVNGPGDVLMPACFTAAEQEVSVAMVDGRAGSKAEPLRLASGPKSSLSFVMDSMFELFIEPLPQLDDGGYLKRRYAAHFNNRLEEEVARGAKPSCTLRPVKLPALAHRTLILYSSETRKEVALPSADLDPETPMTTSSASYDQRRQLDPKDPGSLVSGCQGVVELDRLVSQSTREYPSKTEHLIVRGVVGTTSDGELCDRFTMIRRVDPQALLDLYSLHLPERIPGLPTTLGMNLTEWVGQGAFRATVGPAEFELSQIDEPRIRVTLVKAPPEVAPAPAAVPTRLSSREPRLQDAEAVQPPTKTEPRIRKWTDESGVVSYGDASAAPPAR